MSDTLTNDAELAILTLLKSGEVAVGERLSIRRLSTALKYGFMPVQDALKRLEAKRWVVIVPGHLKTRGTYVLRTQ